jgi:16S rRNA (guanine1516-N2)-methyltransferase
MEDEKQLADYVREKSDGRLYLSESSEGLSLTDGKLTLRADFRPMIRRLKQSNMEHEMLVRASRIRGLDAAGRPKLAIDATAGFGEDSLLLAAAGVEVRLFERDPVIAALLEDAMRRALAIPELRETVLRMTLTAGDSIRLMPGITPAPDLVYLDPMFPGRTKSALVGKKFQLLHDLEQPCQDETALLRAAVLAGPRKIVIKRPAKGPYLAGIRPDGELAGKAVRYDSLFFPEERRGRLPEGLIEISEQ